MPSPARPAHSGVVHAAGRPVAARVPGAAGRAYRCCEACRTPDLIAEITLQPVRRHGVDAAILFSDIVVPLAAAGVDLDIEPGVGPVIAKPVGDRDDVAAMPVAGRRTQVGFVDRGGPAAGRASWARPR